MCKIAFRLSFREDKNLSAAAEVPKWTLILFLTLGSLVTSWLCWRRASLVLALGHWQKLQCYFWAAVMEKVEHCLVSEFISTSRQTFVISTWFTASLGFCLMKVTYSGVPKKSTVKSYGRWKLGCALRSVWFYIFFLFFCSLLKSMSYGFQKLNVWLKDLFSKATILLQLLLA